MGISGILRPNGIFVSCSYGNHGMASSEIPEKESEYCIYLSSGMETKNSDKESIIYFTEKMTKEQKKWFLRNYFKLDKVQRKYLWSYIYGNSYKN